MDESELAGSILGEGSIIAIITLSVVSAGIVLWFCITKKKRQIKTAAETASENE